MNIEVMWKQTKSGKWVYFFAKTGSGSYLHRSMKIGTPELDEALKFKIVKTPHLVGKAFFDKRKKVSVKIGELNSVDSIERSFDEESRKVTLKVGKKSFSFKAPKVHRIGGQVVQKTKDLMIVGCKRFLLEDIRRLLLVVGKRGPKAKMYLNGEEVSFDSSSKVFSYQGVNVTLAELKEIVG